jgi:hypothetical protein
MTRLVQESLSLSPLERFVRNYVEARDGVWDEIEPQVYDLLFGTEMIQIAFDPEALPEHPKAQLASLGSPLIDRLLGDAAERWSSTRLYRIGLNLHVHDLEARARRAISLPLGADLRIERVRPMNFPQAIFWFKATFSGDQKQEEILRVGIDLHYLREVRQLEPLLAAERLCTDPEAHLPETRHAGLVAGYRTAREHAVRTVTSLANARRREWAGLLEKQIARISGYYAQLRQEADEYAARSQFRTGRSDAGTSGDESASRVATRREAIDREERLRIAELRQKSSVRVRVKLASVMVVGQPKLRITGAVTGKERPAGRLDIVWDPLSAAVEAVPCSRCGQPTFALRIDRTGLVCPSCPSASGRR